MKNRLAEFSTKFNELDDGEETDVPSDAVIAVGCVGGVLGLGAIIAIIVSCVKKSPLPENAAELVDGEEEEEE